jgi:Secretion system C-terminal sorting domain
MFFPEDLMKKSSISTREFFLKFFTFQFFFLTILFLFSVKIIGKTDTVYVPRDIFPGVGNLNRAIEAVTDSGFLSNTIFLLEADGYYVLTDSILVPRGERLTITAPEPSLTHETVPPQILCASGPNEFSSPVKFMIKCFGDLILKNLWLLFANTNGWQVSANLQFDYSPEVIGEQIGIFENVIFDYSGIPYNASGAIGIATKHFKGIFKNCYWKNCIDSFFRYYGRAVSFPFNSSGYHVDSLTFENCTFANIGYVYSQEGNWVNEGQYADYIKFNHCTFLNVVMFSLESGWWNKLSVTNSIFVNTFMYGYIPLSDGNEPYGGTIRIDSISSFGFEVPFKDQDRCILFTNSSYYIEKWLNDWMKNNPYSLDLKHRNYADEIPEPQPMLSPGTIRFFESNDFPYMNMANLYDSTDPGFIIAPSDTNAIKEFLYHKWFDSGAESWAWKTENSINRLWPLEEKLAYKNDTLRKAGMGEFPLGDLYHWWPDQYIQWKAQEERENKRISYWLNTGRDSIFTDVKEKPNVIHEYELAQNYPNPFNPTTNIEFRIADFGLVILKVYDILGREIATLVNEEKNPGNYVEKFNGTGLASGIYFYQLRSKNFMKTKKLVLLK